MNVLLKNAMIYAPSGFHRQNIAVENGRISFSGRVSALPVLDCSDLWIFPGFVDVHTHLREPGFSYKETIASGTRAAAHGGYTTVCTMPNLNPVPDNAAHLRVQLNLIRRDAVVHVHPYGAITCGERGAQLADMASMAADVVGFSDDGKGVQSEAMMRQAMTEAKRLGKPIAAHCEDESLLHGGYIHDGAYAAAHGHRTISGESEWRQIARDLALVRETGCAYHVCHVSTRESVALIRRAKANGLDVTCETAPHYLILDETDLQEDGRFKMNPPLRAKADREALIAAAADGTIDMIATDHAPHSDAEKARGLAGSAMGVTGLETAFPMLYTRLVQTGALTLERLIALLHDAPMRRFGVGTELADGAPADLTVFDLAHRCTIDRAFFVSGGKCSPFAGESPLGICRMTMVGGNIVWQSN